MVSRYILKMVGWVIVRFSGTEPLIRVFWVKMENEKDAGEVIDLVKEFIE